MPRTLQHMIEKTIPKGYDLEGDTFVEVYANTNGAYPFTVKWTNGGVPHERAHGLWTLRDAIEFADQKIQTLRNNALIDELAAEYGRK